MYYFTKGITKGKLLKMSALLRVIKDLLLLRIQR